MLNRRDAIVTATAAVASSQLPTQAADALVEVKIDPWNQPPEIAAKRIMRFPKLDDEARQDFTRGITKFVQHDGNRPEAKAATAAFIQTKGESATAATKLDLEQSFNFMLQQPEYAARTRLVRSNFHIHWDNPRRAFYREYEKYIGAMEATDKAGPGTLELNPNMQVPEYTRYEIHTQPGGYVGDPFAGWIYDYGHYIGTDALRDGGRALSYARNLRVPADKKVRRILDLGCSMGVSTTAIKERFPNAEVWGIDIGGPEIRYAHHRAVKRGDEVHFAQRLAEDTKFPDGHFDIVADCIMFHEVTAQAAKKIVPEIHRILRPGGVFTHSDTITVGQPGYKPAATVLEKASLFINHRENIEPWWVQFIETDFPALARSAGFQVDFEGPGVQTQKDGHAIFSPFYATKSV